MSEDEERKEDRKIGSWQRLNWLDEEEEEKELGMSRKT